MTATLTVPSISCNHCVAAIRSILAQTPGVNSANFDITSKTVLLDIDESKVNLDEIEQKLADADYPVASRQVG